MKIILYNTYICIIVRIEKHKRTETKVSCSKSPVFTIFIFLLSLSYPLFLSRSKVSKESVEICRKFSQSGREAARQHSSYRMFSLLSLSDCEVHEEWVRLEWIIKGASVRQVGSVARKSNRVKTENSEVTERAANEWNRETKRERGEGEGEKRTRDTYIRNSYVPWRGEEETVERNFHIAI